MSLVSIFETLRHKSQLFIVYLFYQILTPVSSNWISVTLTKLFQTMDLFVQPCFKMLLNTRYCKYIFRYCNHSFLIQHQIHSIYLIPRMMFDKQCIFDLYTESRALSRFIDIDLIVTQQTQNIF